VVGKLYFMEKTQTKYPQIKICGLTNIDQAVFCVSAGADAIGCVFYPPSKRHLNTSRAREIGQAISGEAAVVGVFVNASFREIMRKVEACFLTAVQLHGQESPELVQRLRNQGLLVIKGLFVKGDPHIDGAGRYNATAFLVECGQGKLPGGNAMAWNWGAALEFGERHPLILAGGLNPENVSMAVASANPLAVDVSSGVEIAPGDKDLKKVTAFIDAVRLPSSGAPHRTVF
jgi:phosphoribosylanthranilate isomerase